MAYTGDLNLIEGNGIEFRTSAVNNTISVNLSDDIWEFINPEEDDPYNIIDFMRRVSQIFWDNNNLDYGSNTRQPYTDTASGTTKYLYPSDCGALRVYITWHDDGSTGAHSSAPICGVENANPVGGYPITKISGEGVSVETITIGAGTSPESVLVRMCLKITINNNAEDPDNRGKVELIDLYGSVNKISDGSRVSYIHRHIDTASTTGAINIGAIKGIAINPNQES